jgi:hypothetical protein
MAFTPHRQGTGTEAYYDPWLSCRSIALHSFNFRHQIEMSGWGHGPIFLLSGKENPVLTGLEGGWAQATVGGKKFCPQRGSNFDSAVIQPIS